MRYQHHAEDFKAKVILEAERDRESITEIAIKYQINRATLYKWIQNKDKIVAEYYAEHGRIPDAPQLEPRQQHWATRGRKFIFKKNPRRSERTGFLEKCLLNAEIVRKWDNSRGTHEYIGTIDDDPDSPYAIAYRVLEHSCDKDGYPLLFPDYEVEQYATNLAELPADVIELYHDHATSEQGHSELKNDMDFERFASGKFDVNCILLSIASISFNILRMIGQCAISCGATPFNRKKAERMRLKTVIKDLVLFAGEFVKSGRSYELRLYSGDIFSELHFRLKNLFLFHLPQFLI